MLHLFKGLAIHEQRLDAHGRNRTNVLAVRQNESRNMWALIKDLAQSMTERWSKETELGAGARYVLNHFDALTAYLDDPRLEPSNNLRERMLRTEKLIEGSSMFRKSLEGRFVLDVVRTVLQTAVAAGVPAHEYIVSVLRAAPDEVAQRPTDFTPSAWADARAQAQEG
jgi:transposase